MSSGSEWSGKSRGGASGYKIFIFVLKFFGISAAYFILIFVSFYFLLFGGQSTKSNFYFFNTILGKNKLNTIASILKGYFKYGQTLIDKTYVMSNPNHSFHYESSGEEMIRKLSHQKKGAFLISGHLGSWDLAGYFLKSIDVPINIVLFDGEHEKIKAVVEKSVNTEKVKIIPVKNDFSHLISINKALKSGEFVCMHGDRYTGAAKNKCEILPFLGKEAAFPTGPFTMVKKLNVPYLYVYGVKKGKYKYSFFAKTGQKSGGTVKEIMEEYVQTLEEKVKQFPHQWYNYYKFWEDEKVKS